MSLDSLLGEDTATLQQLNGTTPDSSGGKIKVYVELATLVPIRVEDAKAQIKKSYASRQITVTNTVITQEGRGRAGDRWLASDSISYFLIQGVRTMRGLGGIDTFYLYDTLESRI